MKRNQKGFSLIEVVIVVTIVAILAGASASMIRYVTMANTKKTVQTVDNQMDKLQATSMTKAGKQYLYVYKRGGAYYMLVSDIKVNAVNPGEGVNDVLTASAGTQISNGQVTVYANSVDVNQKLNSNGDYICVRYTKSGAFSDTDTMSNKSTETDNKVSSLVFEGKSHTYSIDLVQSTGVHVIK